MARISTKPAGSFRKGGTPVKQRALIILVAILGATCIVLGIFLLRGGKQPETADPTPEATATPTATPEAVSSASEDSAVPYVSPIDFASLQKENPDIYAWLRIPGTEFDFPILQRAGDDDYYLTHDSDGNDNSMGAIFSESSYNDGKMDDPATVLYGHQMLAGTMFGKLQQVYSESNALTEHGDITVYLPEKELHYKVFAAVPYDNRHILYTYDFTSKRRYNAFLNSIFDVREIGAQHSTDVSVTPEDKLLILSTCLQGNSHRRFLVVAKCVDEVE